MTQKRSRRPNRSAEEWSELISEWRRSGLSGRAFARRRDIGVGSLYGWAAKVDGADEARAGEPRFMAVKIVGGEAGGAPAPSGHVELVARGGRVIRIVGPVDADALAVVLEVAERC